MTYKQKSRGNSSYTLGVTIPNRRSYAFATLCWNNTTAAVNYLYRFSSGHWH